MKRVRPSGFSSVGPTIHSANMLSAMCKNWRWSAGMPQRGSATAPRRRERREEPAPRPRRHDELQHVADQAEPDQRERDDRPARVPDPTEGRARWSAARGRLADAVDGADADRGLPTATPGHAGRPHR